MAKDDGPPIEWGEDWNVPDYLKKGIRELDKKAVRYAAEAGPGYVTPVKLNGHAAPSAGPEVIVRRNLIDWADLAERTAPARQWIVDGWLSAHPTLCAGRGGLGKTLMVQELGTALALRLPFLDAIAQAKRVLFWSCEDDRDELWRRQQAICEHFGVPMSALDRKLIVDARAGLENELFSLDFNRCAWSPLVGELEQQINDYRAEVVILDNTAQMYGANPNDQHQVTAFVNGLSGLGHGRALAFVIVAHPARTSGSEFSGSAAWENACRMRWLLGDRLPDAPEPTPMEAAAETNERYLAKRKHNYSERDYRRFVYTNGVLVQENEERRDTRDLYVALKARRVHDVVLGACAQLNKRGISPAAFGGTRSLPRLMHDMGLMGGYGRAEVVQAMHQLINEGRLVLAEERSACRHPRRGLTVVSEPAAVIPFPTAGPSPPDDSPPPPSS